MLILWIVKFVVVLRSKQKHCLWYVGSVNWTLRETGTHWGKFPSKRGLSKTLQCMCVCPYLHLQSLWTRYLTNSLRRFHQIYKFDAFGDGDELVRFWSQKAKGQCHNDTECDQNLLLPFCLLLIPGSLYITI